MTAPDSGTHRLIVGLYTLAIFVSAALLFLVQPMFARMALPLLGGSPAVWNTALVFYQFALLAGYTYAYVATRWLGVRRQLLVHFALLVVPLFILPMRLPDDWHPAADQPAASLLVLLTGAVGLPFFVVSTTSPLLQRWFAASGHPQSSDPYFLYGASNLGSLLALLGYPLLVERWLPLGDQARWWTGGYLLFLALGIGCGAALWKRASSFDTQFLPRAVSEESAAPAALERLRWLGLAAVPVSLMLSVTTYLSTDISAIPLLWVIPLALYLVTFVLTFARRPLVPHRLTLGLAPVVLVALTLLIAAKEEQTNWWLIAAHLVAFFVVAMACHGTLAGRRPAPDRVAEFYLLVSLGGALGGMFNAIVAPLLFDRVIEYPLTLVLAAALLPAGQVPTGSIPREARQKRRSAKPVTPPTAPTPRGVRFSVFLDFALPLAVFGVATALVLALQEVDRQASWPVRGVMFGLPILAGLFFVRRPVRFALILGAVFAASGFYAAGKGSIVYADRTFFGLNRVVLVPSGRYHVLGHGNTTHGAQSLDPARRREPLTYFHPRGPLGQVFAAFHLTHAGARVAVVGLGAGSTACYRQSAEAWTFYELDPSVVEIARDTGLFTFLRECAPDARIVTGDARLSLQSAAPAEYDLIILDAYSSDAIPVHLITREAIRLYLDKLSPDGLLVFNISNRHLDLRTVLANLAADARLVYRERDDLQIDQGLAGRGMMPSQWAVLARTRGALGALADDSRWVEPRPRPGTSVWTDDFNNLWSVFIWE